MTSPEQDKIIEALAAEHGAVKVLPLRGTDAVLVCGWSKAPPPLGLVCLSILAAPELLAMWFTRERKS